MFIVLYAGAVAEATYLIDRSIVHPMLRTRSSFESLALVDTLPSVPALGAYRVRERKVVWRGPSEIFLISTVVRCHGLSPADFDAHWRDVHAPLATKHHLGMCEYRQFVVEEIVQPGSPPCDGIALLGFASLPVFQNGLFDSPAGAKLIGEDTQRFIDLGRAEIALMRLTSAGH